jgi:hypothetical protein
MRFVNPRRRQLGLYLITCIALFWFTPKTAIAYPTGSMSCGEIGDFAAATVEGKQNGQTLKEALAKVNKATIGHALERKNLTQIVRAIYSEAWANKLSEEGARAAFTADCEAQAGD